MDAFLGVNLDEDTGLDSLMPSKLESFASMDVCDGLQSGAEASSFSITLSPDFDYRPGSHESIDEIKSKSLLDQNVGTK